MGMYELDMFGEDCVTHNTYDSGNGNARPAIRQVASHRASQLQGREGRIRATVRVQARTHARIKRVQASTSSLPVSPALFAYHEP